MAAASRKFRCVIWERECWPCVVNLLGVYCTITLCFINIFLMKKDLLRTVHSFIGKEARSRKRNSQWFEMIISMTLTRFNLKRGFKRKVSKEGKKCSVILMFLARVSHFNHMNWWLTLAAAKIMIQLTRIRVSIFHSFNLFVRRVFAHNRNENEYKNVRGLWTSCSCLEIVKWCKHVP